MTNGQNIGFQMTKKVTETPTPLEITIEDTEFDTEGLDNAGDRSMPEYDSEIIDADVAYVGNKNSHVFHYPTCESVYDMKPKNRVFFYSREEAIDLGYKPCQRCYP